MTAALVPFVRCRQCEWQPNPDRKMAAENQANEHGSRAGHAVEYGLEPKRGGK